jgi:electron-transferring-flavoprotein dehydrogenase
VRNVKPLWSKYGLMGGVALGGIDMWSPSPAGTRSAPCATANPMPRPREGANHAPIDYPKPDGVLSFDRLTNVSFSMTNHEESQPAHLTLKDAACPDGGQPARICRAGAALLPGRRLRGRRGGGQGHALRHQLPELRPLQDLRHQGPVQNIHWTVPQGGDGPNYPNM